MPRRHINPYVIRQADSNLEIGDDVLIYRGLSHNKGWDGYFDDQKISCIGKIGRIIGIYGSYGLLIEVDNGSRLITDYFPYFIVKHVHPLYKQRKKFRKFETVVRRQQKKILRRLTRV